jgi:hypothetical protein
VRKEGCSFLKKRTKKLLHVWLRLIRMGSGQIRKSFLLLFFKKEALSLRASRGLTLPEYGNKLGT